MEVKVTKCQNGHYFDSNKHTCCPHCGAQEFNVNSMPKKKDGFGLFKKKEKSMEIFSEHKTKEGSSSVIVEDIVPPSSQQAFIIEDVVTEGAFSNESSLADTSGVETTGLFSNNNDPSIVEDIVTTGMFVNEEPKVTENELTSGLFSKEPISNETSHNGNSLLEEIKNVTADNDARTIGIFSLGNNQSNNITPVEEPVVGWMVCIKGKNIGKDFKIIAGKNSIGRNGSNVISLENEESVSREKHAWIIYEPRKREFFVKPGESSGLTYLNDENIFDAEKLAYGDILEFGETKFIFVPLCGENFSWSDYVNKE